MQKNNSNKILYQRLIVRLLLAITFAALLINVFPTILKLFAPFVIAFIVATILNPLISKINKKVSKLNINFMVSRKIITLIITFVIVFLFTFLTFNLINLIVKEIVAFLIGIQESWDNIELRFFTIQENLKWLTDYLPKEALDGLQGLESNLFNSIHNIIKGLVSTIFYSTTTIISKTSTIVVALLSFFMALYFIVSDFNGIYDFFKKHINKGIFDTLILLKNSVINATGGFLRGLLAMAFIAFAFMFIALSIYRQPYAFVIALFLGFIDFLPLLGTIAILLPWGIIELLLSNMNKGIFLILLGIAFFLFRRIVEPKVMGSQTGLHPLLSLMSIYVGLQFSGVWGAILTPILLLTVISVVKSGVFDNTISDIKQFYYIIVDLLDSNNQNNIK